MVGFYSEPGELFRAKLSERSRGIRGEETELRPDGVEDEAAARRQAAAHTK